METPGYPLLLLEDQREMNQPPSETTAFTIIHVHLNKYPIFGQHRVGSRKNSLSAVVGVVGDDKCAASTVRYLNQYNDRLEDASCPID